MNSLQSLKLNTSLYYSVSLNNIRFFQHYCRPVNYPFDSDGLKVDFEKSLETQLEKLEY